MRSATGKWGGSEVGKLPQGGHESRGRHLLDTALYKLIISKLGETISKCNSIT